ncbi:putative DNA modification/repair radical SAM protein [Alistipes sp. OttesenSCG-928-B03]|nr:putative DNA modification/repair radical SAM protein [Alistipes sp. OttesenSCG-928-B03]
MNDAILQKLTTLAESAKYDVSCASSGTTRSKEQGKVGSAHGWGICHSFTEDGRCVSLLKIMLTNNCIYDCAYCINRRSNDRPRATLSVTELVTLTMEFYRRNYIEGLFLSSGVVRSPDYTMERMVRVVKELRTTHRFNGYIHMKSIPGASRELVNEAGLYADRMSVNIEIPTEQNLRLLAPEKDYASIYSPMRFISDGAQQALEDRRRFRSAPRFVPAGQSTQMIVGATNENDRDILRLSSALYTRPLMKRVYYSGFVPVNGYDQRLPALRQPPLVRENRLYQADWLMRFYGFRADEIADDSYPHLDLEIDPKLSWALRHPEAFPIDLNRADYEMILRVPGIGVKSARQIVASRRFGRITTASLKKMGAVMKKAQYFITCGELSVTARTVQEVRPEVLRRMLIPQRGRNAPDINQLVLFPAEQPPAESTLPLIGIPPALAVENSRQA